MGPKIFFKIRNLLRISSGASTKKYYNMVTEKGKYNNAWTTTYSMITGFGNENCNLIECNGSYILLSIQQFEIIWWDLI